VTGFRRCPSESDRAVELDEGGAAFPQQDLSGGGQRGALVGPHEQDDVKVSLDLADGTAHSRLADIQLLGGAGEASRNRDSQEVPKFS
jgi:hypothetical protein